MPEIDGKPAHSLWPISIHNGIVFGRALTYASAVPRKGTIMTSHPLLFDLRTGRFTMLTQAFGLVGNSMGWVVHEADRMFVAAPTGRADLPPLGSPGGDGPSFMSADGLVIGGKSNDASGEMQAVRWRCARGG
jgi:hypothetical protein